MRLIVDAYKSAGRSDAPIIVNLTGNVTNQDQELYFENGSSGVLSKPTKVVDLVGLLESQFQVREHYFFPDARAITSCLPWIC
mmetsp:Transcript_9046/g.20377  ORF Transcript_9046/g.20377 Transcript_9046/m.20377 type:complete len:83 (-) Transcript_9046:413-661(-)